MVTAIQLRSREKSLGYVHLALAPGALALGVGRLGRYFGTGAEYWAALQLQHDVAAPRRAN